MFRQKKTPPSIPAVKLPFTKQQVQTTALWWLDQYTKTVTQKVFTELERIDFTNAFVRNFSMHVISTGEGLSINPVAMNYKHSVILKSFADEKINHGTIIKTTFGNDIVDDPYFDLYTWLKSDGSLTTQINGKSEIIYKKKPTDGALYTQISTVENNINFSDHNHSQPKSFGQKN